MRDVDFLARKAAEHGPSVGDFAKALLASPLPWTRMRQVYALLGLAKRYGDSRLDAACATALQADMIDVYRLRRLLELAPPPTAPGRDPNKVVPLARYLRPPKQYALPLPMREHTDKGDNA